MLRKPCTFLIAELDAECQWRNTYSLSKVITSYTCYCHRVWCRSAGRRNGRSPEEYEDAGLIKNTGRKTGKQEQIAGNIKH